MATMRVHLDQTVASAGADIETAVMTIGTTNAQVQVVDVPFLLMTTDVRIVGSTGTQEILSIVDQSMLREIVSTSGIVPATKIAILETGTVAAALD